MADILLVVGATLVFSLVFSEAAERLGEPGFLGEILAGVVLGPSLLGLIGSGSGGTFEGFATIGALLLFFDVGYEQIDLDDLLSAGRPVLIVAAFGMAVPFLTGLAIGLGFGYSLESSTYLALILSVTSIAITARTLLSLDSLDTDFGRWILGAAVVDNVTGVLALSVLPLFASGSGLGDSAVALGEVLAFFLAAALFYRFALAHVSDLVGRASGAEADFLAVMALVFLFGYGAEAVSLSTTIGALVAGLVVSTNRRFEGRAIREGVAGIAYGVFIPLYFASIGTFVNASIVSSLDLFVLVVVLAGLLTKFLAGYLGNLAAGGSRDTSLVVGIGLIPRSETGVAIIAAGVAGGLIDRRIFIAYLLLLVLSVFLTPLLLKRAVSRLRLSQRSTL